MRGFRVASMATVALSLAILPIGDAAICLALMLALDGAAVALVMRRRARRASSGAAPVAPLGAVASVALFRRTVPGLRSRRPAAIIEAQVAWRQAAEFRRRGGGIVRRPGRP